MEPPNRDGSRPMLGLLEQLLLAQHTAGRMEAQLYQADMDYARLREELARERELRQSAEQRLQQSGERIAYYQAVLQVSVPDFVDRYEDHR